MQELLDKFQRDRWVEVLTNLYDKMEYSDGYNDEDFDTVQQVIDYLKGKEVKNV